MKDIIIQAILFILPAWIANFSLTLWGKIKKIKKIKLGPLDNNKLFFDKKRIIGNSVDLIGLPVATLTGLMIGIIQNRVVIGLIMGFSAYFGHLVGSFIKRRLNLKGGQFLPIIDHSDHTLMALLLTSLFITLTSKFIFLIILLTLLIHPLACIIGYFLKLKEVPW